MTAEDEKTFKLSCICLKVYKNLGILQRVPFHHSVRSVLMIERHPCFLGSCRYRVSHGVFAADHTVRIVFLMFHFYFCFIKITICGKADRIDV